jgi:hypothetical protein
MIALPESMWKPTMTYKTSLEIALSHVYILFEPPSHFAPEISSFSSVQDFLSFRFIPSYFHYSRLVAHYCLDGIALWYTHSDIDLIFEISQALNTSQSIDTLIFKSH